MDSQLETALNEFGLSKGEVKAYIALLTLRDAGVAEISRKSGVHRVNMYGVLEKLEAKGLVTHIIQGTHKSYSPSNPEHLIDIVEQKREALLEVLPKIKKILSGTKKEQKVFHFFGAQGLIEAYYMMLGQDKEILGLGGSGLNRKILGHKHEIWNKKRIQKNIPLRAVYYEFTREGNALPWNDSITKIKYLSNENKTDCMIDICGDLVVNLIPIEDNVQVVIVQNQELADTYRTFFELIWKQAKE